jgi:hypothetical protein
MLPFALLAAAKAGVTVLLMSGALSFIELTSLIFN